MGRSKETFFKKEVRNKQEKKRKEKVRRREERKEQGKSSFDDMIVWVDENGQLRDTPPDPTAKTEVKLEEIEISVPKGGNVKEVSKYRGKLFNFDEDRGFGFITSPQFTESIFIHANSCEEPLKNGLKVEFETEKGTKGLRAINVIIL